MIAPTDNPETLLDSANRGLARLLGHEVIPLTSGGSRSMDDPLWVWGVLGGKEVGKSTLINALAGSAVAAPTERVGEGTYRPAAYCTASDLAALRIRFADLQQTTIDYRPEAPEDRRGLVLVDLPDFDSLFTPHIDLVRDVARVLDGIIWVTTPKKVADHKGIEEIRQVLKARSNFVYVVNKVDWLLGQSNGAPQAALQRTRQALGEQISASAGTQTSEDTFLISARHRHADDILQSIAHSRDLAGPQDLLRDTPQLADVAGHVAEEFRLLERRLTSALSTAEAEANKRANLNYQIMRQTSAVIEHHRPHGVLQRLQEELSPAGLHALAVGPFTPEFCVRLTARLQDPERLSHTWAGQLFRLRIADWPLLGLIAWPLLAVGAALASLKHLRRQAVPPTHDDAYRIDGLDLIERTQHLMTAVENQLNMGRTQLNVCLPTPEALARQFRSEADEVVSARADAVIAPHAQRRPGVAGRLIRWIIPIGVLAWFPLIQPLLEALLSAATGQLSWNLETLRIVVSALSAQHVLAGLLVAVLILAALVAAIYSGAVRDAATARARLTQAGPQDISAPLLTHVVAAIRGPIESAEQELEHHVMTLDQLIASGPNPPS